MARSAATRLACPQEAACSIPGARRTAHGAPLVGVAAVDGALDLEQRIEVSDRLPRDRRDRFALLTLPGIFLYVSHSKKPRGAWAKQNAGVIGSSFRGGSNSGSKPL